MPKDQVVLLDSLGHDTINARIVLADGTTAIASLWSTPRHAGGRIYQNKGQGIATQHVELASLVPAEGGIVRADLGVDPQWMKRLPAALRAALAAAPAESAPAETVRIRADRNGIRRTGVLAGMSDLDDAPVLEIVLRPDGILAAREWEPQRAVPTAEPGVRAIRDAWTPWVEARPSDAEIRAIRDARGPDRGALLEDAYWTHLNPLMEDPLLLPEDPWLEGRPLAIRGGQDLLDELLTLAAWADPETAAGLPGVLAVAAARPDHPEHPARLSPEDSTVRIGTVLATYAEAILAHLAPEGIAISYNDGASRRRSGYDACGILHEIEIPAASAHERLDAARRLAEWHARHAPEPR